MTSAKRAAVRVDGDPAQNSLDLIADAHASEVDRSTIRTAPQKHKSTVSPFEQSLFAEKDNKHEEKDNIHTSSRDRG